LRGFAHVGALSALEELGVHPDMIVGTSAGAVVGAAYASGLTPDEIKSVALNLKISSLIDFTLSTKGFIRGNKLARWIDHVTKGVPIEKFPTRFAAVATDLDSGRAVLLNSGSAGSVVQASSAVPGINMPVHYDGGYLIDGGVASLVPVRFARAMGADVVIAVDIYCQSPRSQGIGAPTVISNVLHAQSCLIAESEIAEADVVISPALSVPSMSSKDAQEQIIHAGYEATYAAVRNWQAATETRNSTNSRPAVGRFGREGVAMNVTSTH
jgi:NTE family protein